MPASGFAFPLNELKEDLDDDSNSCFDFGDSQGSNLFYDPDGTEKEHSRDAAAAIMHDSSGEHDSSHSNTGQSIVSISAKKLLEKKHRRAISVLLRKKPNRENSLDQPEYHSSAMPSTSTPVLSSAVSDVARPPKKPLRDISDPDHSAVDTSDGVSIHCDAWHDGQSVVSAITYDDESTITSFTPSTPGSQNFWKNKRQETSTFSQHRNCQPPQRSTSSSFSATPSSTSADQSGSSQTPTQVPLPCSSPEEALKAYQDMQMSLPSHSHFLSMPLNEEDEHESQSHDDNAGGGVEEVSVSGQKIIAKQQRQIRHPSYQKYVQYMDVKTSTTRRMTMQKAKSVSNIQSLEHQLMALPTRSLHKNEQEHNKFSLNVKAWKQEAALTPAARIHQAPKMPVRSGESISTSDDVSGMKDSDRFRSDKTRSLSPIHRASNRWTTGAKETFTVKSTDIAVAAAANAKNSWRLAPAIAPDDKQLLFERELSNSSQNTNSKVSPKGRSTSPHRGVLPGRRLRPEAGLSRSMSTPNLVVVDEEEEHDDLKGSGKDSLPPKKIESTVSFLLGEGIELTDEQKAKLNQQATPGVVEISAEKKTTTHDVKDEIAVAVAVDNVLDIPKDDKSSTESTELLPPALISPPLLGSGGHNEHLEWNRYQPTVNSLEMESTSDTTTSQLPDINEYPMDFGDEKHQSKGIIKKLKKQMKASSRYLRNKANLYTSRDKDDLARLNKSMSSFGTDEAHATGAFYMERLEGLPEDAVADAFDTTKPKFEESSLTPISRNKDEISPAGSSKGSGDTSPKIRSLGKTFQFLRSASVPNLSHEVSRKGDNSQMDDTIAEEESATEETAEVKEYTKRSIGSSSPLQTKTPRQATKQRESRNKKAISTRHLGGEEHSSNRPAPKLLVSTKGTTPVQLDQHEQTEKDSLTPVREKGRSTRHKSGEGNQKIGKSSRRGDRRRSKSASARPRHDKQRASKMSQSLKSRPARNSTNGSSTSSLSTRNNNESTSLRSEGTFFSIASTLREDARKKRKEGRSSLLKHASMRDLDDSRRKSQESSQSFLTQQIRKMPDADPLLSCIVHTQGQESPATPSTTSSSSRYNRMHLGRTRMAQSERFLGGSKSNQVLGSSASSMEDEKKGDKVFSIPKKHRSLSRSASRRNMAKRKKSTKRKQQLSSRKPVATTVSEDSGDGSCLQNGRRLSNDGGGDGGGSASLRQSRRTNPRTAKASTPKAARSIRPNPMQRAQSLRSFGY